MVQNIKAKEIFQSQISEVLEKFPSLKVVEGEEIYIAGTLDIIDNLGKKWETYSVEIKPSEGFPFRFPMLFETGTLFPRVADWHINPDGSCCVDVEPNEILYCLSGITILQFLINKAIPFLNNQTYRRIEGVYANGEYPHGIKGIYTFYCQILRVNNVNAVLRLLKFIILNNRPSRTSLCFCGRREKFRNCHRDAYDKIKSIDKEVLIKHYERMSSSQLT